MNFLNDKALKRFFIGIILFILFLFIIDIAILTMQKNDLKNLTINNNNAVSSYLLEQGVPENIVAKAITNNEITENGEIFLNKIGINKNTNLPFLHFIYNLNFKFIIINCIKFLFLSIFLLTIITLFIYRRERLYKQASKIVYDYSEGNFKNNLPELYDGSIYHLFSCINNMAYVLKSKNELDHNTKEFLKNTISDISHQLKTPLSALSMYNEIILDEPQNKDTVVLFAEKSDVAINRIKTLILSLLKITKLDAKGIVFEKQEYLVLNLINLAVENLTIRSENEKKKIIINGNQNDTIICDINWTSEAILNIVKNSLDYTKANGEIHISWEKTPIEIRIFIADNGVGIEEKDFHHIFKRFYRSKNSTDSQGIGLGLPLAKSIIEQQGGTILLQSQLKKGTVFTITLPYKNVS